jgi:hypothetical protein
MRRTGPVLALVVMFSSIQLYAQCGVERWSIKTGTDAQAPSINLSTYISTTIYNMWSSTAPSSLPANSRIAPRELNQYRLSGTLTKYKRETDSDYHLVIQDGSGRTMIVEIPSINCVGGGSPFGTGISHARAQFDAKLTATSTMKTTSVPVTIKGIGFWDFIHGQTGVAPNGIEVHPVLDITFNAAIASSPDSPSGDGEVSVPPVALPADLVEDDDGGRVQVYRGGDALAGILFHGGPVIENPRLRVVFAGDGWNASSREAIVNMVRGINADSRFETLSRYGVRTSGMPLESELSERRQAAMERRSLFDGAGQVGAAAGELNDLDVQRLLATAVEQGRIQQTDANALTVVFLDSSLSLAVGSTRDWLSYHSLFHPTEIGMPYVVVRGGQTAEALRESLFAGVARALVNPAGNGWF